MNVLFSRITGLLWVICGSLTIIGLVLIVIKKPISRGPVQPIPVSNIVQRINANPNTSNNEDFELQPIETISRNVNMIQINVPESNNPETDLVPNNMIILDDTLDEPNHHILNEFLFKFLKIGTATSSPQVSVALHQNCIFNNQKFNKSMISIYGLMFLFGMVILILVPSWITYYMKDGEDPEMIYKLIYMLLCSLPVALPIIYFILNPKHFIIAVNM